jgi:hypothetical protein
MPHLKQDSVLTDRHSMLHSICFNLAPSIRWKFSPAADCFCMSVSLSERRARFITYTSRPRCAVESRDAVPVPAAMLVYATCSTGFNHCVEGSNRKGSCGSGPPASNTSSSSSLVSRTHICERKLGAHALRSHTQYVMFITAGPSTKLFAWGEGGYWRTCATRDDEPRPVWTSLLITH